MTPLPPAAGTPCLWCGRPIDLTRTGASRMDGDPGWYEDACYEFAPVVRAASDFSSRPSLLPSPEPL